MRPEYTRRAQRAFAALGVVAVAGGASDALASAVPAGQRAALPVVSAVPPEQPAALSVSSVVPTAQWTMARVASALPVGQRATLRHRVRHAQRRVLLHARMLHHEVLIGQDIAFIGVTRPGRPHRLVGIDQRRGRDWVAVARVRTDRRGHFLVRYWPHAPGQVRLRARLAGAGGPGTTVQVPVATVFHAVVASWYGPGGRTACGETLTASTLGVANRTLPCGTLVTLRYRDRTVRVPVIDRGPFVTGRDYDLTWATKLALGAGDVTVIWASA
jgi:rare lipoprotein A